MDLDGYVPDFILLFHQPIVVEIKPYTTLGELYEDSEHAMARINLSGWDKEALLLGTQPFECSPALGFQWGPTDTCLGMLREKCPAEEGWDWNLANSFKCAECDRQSFCHSTGFWQCRVRGCYEGNATSQTHECRMVKDFRVAGNAVQWSPR